MKKVNSKQIFTYVVLIGLLVLIMVYFLVYQKNMEKAETLEASNNTLEDRVDSLKVYADNEKQYKADMETMKPEIAKIVETYPAANLEEDVIMQAIKTQMATPVVYDVIVIGEDEPYKIINEDVVKGAAIEAYQKEISFVETNAVYESTLTYSSLKAAIQSLFDSNYEIGIKGITFAKQGEELDLEKECDLKGNFELVFYSVKGNTQTYTKPNILPYIQGTKNFFSELRAIVEVE